MQPIYARIYKVDEARQEVTGCAVAEVIDRESEIFDYATSKPEFMKWSAEVSNDTNGQSLGNVRSMHGNVCAGKLTDIQFDDVEKAINVTAKIVDPVEWKKVTEGCYSGFSIGGRYAKKWAEPINGRMVQRYTAVPSEISIVDRPCVPTAKFHNIHKFDGFKFVKKDGAVEKRFFMNDMAIKFNKDIGKFEVVQKGGPGSGPHPGSGKKSKAELRAKADKASDKSYTHGNKADSHDAKMERASEKGDDKLADLHGDAMDAHAEATNHYLNAEEAYSKGNEAKGDAHMALGAKAGAAANAASLKVRAYTASRK